MHSAERLCGGRDHLIVWHVAQVLSDVPVMPERVLKLAMPVTPEHHRQRLTDLCARRHRLREHHLSVSDVESLYDGRSANRGWGEHPHLRELIGDVQQTVANPQLDRHQPSHQKLGSGWRSRGAAGIRLVQDSFNVGSLSLYASLGFEVKEPAVVISGRPVSDPAAGIEVRPLAASDLQGCEELCLKVHGFERTNELRDAIQVPALSPFVAVRDGRISAYATTLTFFPAAHAVADTEGDMRALILGAVAAEEQPASFLLPTRQADLFRWCLDEGLRVIKPVTYMAIGEYREPTGHWIPSILY